MKPFKCVKKQLSQPHLTIDMEIHNAKEDNNLEEECDMKGLEQEVVYNYL